MPRTEETSQVERNKTIIRSFIEEVFNEHNLSSIEKYFDKDSMEGFKHFLTDFFNAFPDWRVTIEHMIAENNIVVAFLYGSGTHRGKFREVPPTNKPVNIRSADLYRVEDGIITGHWDVVDQLNLLNQTGALLSEDVNKEFKDAN
jgi:predicted ester cyclase